MKQLKRFSKRLINSRNSVPSRCLERLGKTNSTSLHSMVLERNKLITIKQTNKRFLQK